MYFYITVSNLLIEETKQSKRSLHLTCPQKSASVLGFYVCFLQRQMYT